MSTNVYVVIAEYGRSGEISYDVVGVCASLSGAFAIADAHCRNERNESGEVNQAAKEDYPEFPPENGQSVHIYSYYASVDTRYIAIPSTFKADHELIQLNVLCRERSRE